jgi:glycine cleavage system transcriptional repressor
MQLALTFLGHQQPNFIVRLLQIIAESSCTVRDCHSDMMENLSAGHLMIDGDWHEIARLENTLKQLEAEPGLQISLSRAESWKPNHPHIPYTIEVYAADRTGILQELTQFLQIQNILITQIKTCRNRASKVMAELFCVNLSIAIPSHTHIISLREEFLDFCDNANIDAILEPVKF